MKNPNLLVMNRPAGWFGALWKEALPLGNGETGAMVYGGVQDETVTITRHDLWHWGEDAPLPDVRETLALSREAMDRGDYATANRLLSDTLKEKGYVSDPAVPFPLADLRVHVGHDGCFYDYRRELDMGEGEASILYRQGALNFRRRCFISRENGLLLYEIQADSPCASLEAELVFHQDGTPNTNRMLEEQKDFLVEKAETDGKDGYLYWRGKNGEDEDYGAVARVISNGTDVKVCHRKVVAGNASRMLILVRTFAKIPCEKAFEQFRQELSRTEPDYEAHKNRHLPLHQTLYDRCDLSLGEPADEIRNCEDLLQEAYSGKVSPELLEKLWRFGRYLFLSGTAEGFHPFSLYGLWNGEYNPVWSQNVANENVEILYWHIMTGGLEELVRPLIDYYWNMVPKMRENAQKLFGCRGIFLSTYTTPRNAYISPVVPVITNWIGGAGWICQHFFQYYRQTGDRELFREKILPFMVEAARFYCDYAVWQPDGTIKLYPSVSPENSPANFIPEDGVVHLGHAMPAVKNATMDFAIMKELLTNLLSVAEEYPELCSDAEEWRKVLTGIPSYQINEDGAIKEWMDPELRDFYCHRHLSHLYPVFPGNEITPENETLWKAFQRAVDLRELGGQVGWSLVHMASIYARFGRGEDSAECMDMLVKGVTLPNLMMISNDYRSMGVTMDVGQFAPIQLDANMGLVNALQEMLFHEDQTSLTLLPACPERLSKGGVRDFHFAGGTVSFCWNRDAKELMAEFVFNKAGIRQILLPEGWGEKWIVSGPNCPKTEVSGRRISLTVQSGDRIQIRCDGIS